MSIKSRRKTLSHLEVESFLNDIHTNINENNFPNNVELKKVTDKFSHNILDAHDNHIAEKKRRQSWVPISIPIDENQLSASLHTQDNDNHKIQEIYTDKNSELEHQDEEFIANIRLYCKELVRDKMSIDSIETRKNVGRYILEKTSYNLVSTRILYPERFEHPASTLDGKKFVLLSIAPSLEVADKQRKLDTQATENFTRCKVCKSRGRLSHFEYRDIDIDMVISESEYEKRYLLFLQSLRKKPDEVLNLSSDMKFSLVEEESEIEDFLGFDDDSDFNLDSQIPKKTKSSRERRVTLSPASAKAAILEIDNRRDSLETIPPLELQLFENTEMLVDIDYHSDTSATNVPAETFDSIPIVASLAIPTEDDIVDNFKNELDALLADKDDGFFLTPQTSYLENVEPVRDVIVAEDILLEEITPHDTIINESVQENLEVNNANDETLNESTTITNEQYFNKIEEEANIRLNIRLYQARWKYVWEIVSVQAALQAQKYLK